MDKHVSERWIIFLIGAVQFVNVLDFTMVLPMGPDFAAALGIATSKLGFIGGSYTVAAAIAGVAASPYLDRMDRRNALALAMGGLVLATAVGGLAVGIKSLIAARLLAGAFGGPATSLAYSIVADVIPAHRRGKAMGAVMGAYSVASVLGVPAGLQLAHVGGWRTPFFAVAAVGVVVAGGAALRLPSLRGHLDTPNPLPLLRSFADLLSRPTVRRAYLMTATLNMGSFMLVPNISSYLTYNLGYPRDQLGMLYLVGGSLNFLTQRGVGRLVDRFGSFRIGVVGTLMLLIILYKGFVAYSPVMPIMAIFVGYMLAQSFRNVPYNTLISKVPSPPERARFMSLQSAVQHMAAAVGAFASSQLLTESADHQLQSMASVGGISMALAALLPGWLWSIESRVHAAAMANPACLTTSLRTPEPLAADWPSARPVR